MLLRSSKPPFLTLFGREITLALVIKFLLLAALGWLFYSGTKPHVDETVIANKLFGLQKKR